MSKRSAIKYPQGLFFENGGICSNVRVFEKSRRVALSRAGRVELDWDFDLELEGPGLTVTNRVH